ncbi:hypothetical protein HK098_001610 [Nowakowskiella sp. JEL0407]|nr:hypothetical protein HK098_001610 [Nowakowskiella sp. JEL0407]
MDLHAHKVHLPVLTDVRDDPEIIEPQSLEQRMKQLEEKLEQILLLTDKKVSELESENKQISTENRVSKNLLIDVVRFFQSQNSEEKKSTEFDRSGEKLSHQKIPDILNISPDIHSLDKYIESLHKESITGSKDKKVEQQTSEKDLEKISSSQSFSDISNVHKPSKLNKLMGSLSFLAQMEKSRNASRAVSTINPPAAFDISEVVDYKLLKSFPIFFDFPTKILEQIAESWFEVRKKAGQNIIREGDTGSEVYFIVEGTVAFLHQNSELTTLSRGQFFGEFGLLLDSRRGATVAAKTNCHLLILTKNRLITIVKNNQPELLTNLELAAQSRAQWWENVKTEPNLDYFGREFSLDIARRDIRKLSIFEEADEMFVQKLAMQIKPEVFPSGSLIISKGDISNCMYFIVRGTIEVIGNKNTVHAEMTNGQFFGEVGIVMEIERTASIRAKDECYLFKLTKSVLDEVCKEYPIIREKIKQTAQERYSQFLARDEKVELFDVEVTAQSLMKVLRRGHMMFLSIDDLLFDYVDQLELFQSLDSAMLTELAISMSRKTYQPSEKIVVCGDTSDSMFFLAMGDANIESEFGEIIDVASGPYSWFGEVGILQDVPRTASVVAKTTCSVYRLAKTNVLEILSKHPDIGEKIHATAEARMQKYLMRSILA